MKRTKIVCTIGPASDKKTVLKKLVKNGMNVARLNFSHNVHSYHLKVIKNIRSVSRELKTPIAILLDLQGPRIRLGDLPEKGIQLKKGQKIILTTESKYSTDKIPVTYDLMHKDVKAGHRVLIADGLINLIAEKVQGKNIYCEVVNGGLITSHKGINLPDSAVSVPSLSAKDKDDLLFGVKNNVDFVALSFVRNAQEVKSLKKLIKQYEKKLNLQDPNPIKVIVKIERKEAIENIDSIIEATDAVMVARGDLGIELPAEEVPLIQKSLIEKCLKSAKPVIVATQMLESMIVNPRPTRAEISDVANAVIDHTDAVMLSGESAMGKFPAEAVDYMQRTLEKTEASIYDDLVLQDKVKKYEPITEAVGRMAKVLSEKVKVNFILISCCTGASARIVSRYRPELPIFVFCESERVKRQLALTWGAQAFVISKYSNVEELIKKAETHLKKNKLAKAKDKMIVIGEILTGKNKGSKIIEIREVK